MDNLILIIWMALYPVCANVSYYYLHKVKQMYGGDKDFSKSSMYEAVFGMLIYIWVAIKIWP